jgi:trypsin
VRPEFKKRLLATIAAGVLVLTTAGVAGTASGAAELRQSPEPDATASVIGGSATPISKVPWQVALVSNGRGSTWERQFCGGTLVAPTIVVTAAHCVLEGARQVPVSSYRVVSGRSALNDVGSGSSTRVIDSVIWVDDFGKPLYDGDQQWDVALVVLDSPAAGTPISIAGPDERSLWAPGRLARVSGWGVTESAPYGTNYLRSTSVALLPDSACRRAYRGHGGFRSATQTCGGRALGRHDTCQGDSGGPLVAYSADGTPRLVGVTSFGEGCAGKYFPGVYARVAADPIRSTVEDFINAEYGISVVGSGESAPGRLSALAARENAWIYLEPDCFGWHPCDSYDVEWCRPADSGHRCLVSENAYTFRDGRFSCARQILVGVSGGSIFREPATQWTCRRGWR